MGKFPKHQVGTFGRITFHVLYEKKKTKMATVLDDVMSVAVP